MHNIIALTLIFLAGWTFSSHIAVFTGKSLQYLIFISPFIICAIGIVFFWLSKRGCSEVKPVSYFRNNRAEAKSSCLEIVLLAGVILSAAVLYFSWLAFWFLSLFILIYSIIHKSKLLDESSSCGVSQIRRWQWSVVFCLSIAAALLTLAVSRSDMDDAFYVAISAFSASHPQEALFAFDPMHGDRSLPLMFPTYRFAASELLVGAFAYLLNISAMDVAYKILPPVWAMFSVVCIFLLAQELMPRRWIMLGIATLFLILILGECHRGPANMAFVRLFQGKAVYVSAIVPAIFYLTARYFSPRGKAADLFLLGCVQITAIGMTGSAILFAPMAGFIALLSNYILFSLNGGKRKLKRLLGTFLIVFPYAAIAIFELQNRYLALLPPFKRESSAQIWESIFGSNQQYLLAILLLSGPLLAKDRLLRYRLAIPTFLFFMFLAPWFTQIFYTPIYWRISWLFPILIFSACSICIILDKLFFEKDRKILVMLLFALILYLIAVSLPLNTLRVGNNVYWGFAERKIPSGDLAVAEKAAILCGQTGMLLAPEAIAGIISRFEKHPVLICVRREYIDALASEMGLKNYSERLLLCDFVSGKDALDWQSIQKALESNNVKTIVIHSKNMSVNKDTLFEAAGFYQECSIHNYQIWIDRRR